MATCLSAEPGRKAPYSNDLCWRIVWQKAGMELSFRHIARDLNISISTSHSVYKKFQETGDVSPKIPDGEGKRILTEQQELLVIGLLLDTYLVPVRGLPNGLEDHWCAGFSSNHLSDHPQKWADEEEGSGDCSTKIECLSRRLYGRSPMVFSR